MFHVKHSTSNKHYNSLIMNNKTLLDNLRCIPDFPKKGINFRDVTTLYKNAECLQIMLDEMEALCMNSTKIKASPKSLESKVVDLLWQPHLLQNLVAEW